MKKRVLSAIVSVIAGTAASARAQSVNVDFDASAGTPGTGVPASTFGGPAASTGFWNLSAAGVASNIPVQTIAGLSTGVQFTRSNPPSVVVSAFGFNNPNTTGAYELLLDDGDSFAVDQTMNYIFSHLVPGVYEVYTCAIAPDSAAYRTAIAVQDAAEGLQSIGGTMPANAFALGVTHARHTVTVGAPGTIQITASSFSGTANFGTVSGIQIKLITPARVYVKVRSGTGDGLSWGTAFGTVAEALAYATTHSNIHEIWVGQGTYLPTTRANAADPRSVRFNLVNNVTLFGGFIGNENVLGDRGDPALHPTILSGNIGAAGVATDNAYNIVYSDVPFAGLNGVQVSDAYNTLNECGASCFQSFGGGVRHMSGTLTIENSVITRNYTATTEIAGFGGGVYSVGNLRMSKCVISDNQARFGAGVSVGGNSKIFNCRFNRNQAYLSGGGIFTSRTGNLLANCVFAGNKAFDVPEIQGGAALSNGGQTYLVHCTLVGNGGAAGANVITTNPFSDPGSTVTLVNDVIWGNFTPAIYGAATASSCVIEGGFPGYHIINADPSFWNAAGADNQYGTADDDVSLRPNSPCIDAGQSSGSASDVFDYDGNGNASTIIPIDIAGGVRLFDDLGRPNFNTEIIDIGAYEFHGFSCPADFNRDAVVDFFDYLDFVSAFAAAGANADFNGDGVIDFFDYLDFVEAFSTFC